MPKFADRSSGLRTPAEGAEHGPSVRASGGRGVTGRGAAVTGAMRAPRSGAARSQLTSQNVEARVNGTMAFLKDPCKAIAAAQLSVARSALANQEMALKAGNRFSFIGGTVGGGPHSFSDPTLPDRGSLTLATLTETLAVGVGLMRRLYRSDDERGAPQEVVQVTKAFEECLDLARYMPRPCYSEEPLNPEDDREVFHSFLERVVGHVRRLSERPGDVAVLPCGWLRSRSSNDGSGRADEGHCVLLVLARSKEKEEFMLGIANAGEGLQYHPVRPSGAPPAPEMPVRKTFLVLSGIPVGRLRSSGFWYLVYRQIWYPDQSN
ncbi:unnamed protein product, partial [Prorocentrum cordatum]